MVWRAVPVLTALLAATACSGNDESGSVTLVTTPYTGPAKSLAPSQVAYPTVPPPPAPGRCEPAALLVAATLGDPSVDEPPVIVTFTNTGAVDCEVDLGTEWAITHDVEPSVWLTPGTSAALWGDGSECASDSPEWPLEINGLAATVALPAGAPCAVIPTAFFPA